MVTINVKKYYFYLDNTIPDNCIISIRQYEVPSNDNKKGLFNHFFGYLPLSSITAHMFLFTKVFHNCNIIFDSESDIKNLDI